MPTPAPSRVDPENPQRELDRGPIANAKAPATAPGAKLSGDETDQLVIWLGTHTALSRLSADELRSALSRLESEAGFVITKAAPNA